MNWKTETLASFSAVAPRRGMPPRREGAEDSTDPSVSRSSAPCGPDGNTHFQDVPAGASRDGLSAPQAPPDPYRQRLPASRAYRRVRRAVGAQDMEKTS